MSKPYYFGIRHHGPGSARSVVRAFTALKPDYVLIEGPPEADALLHLATHTEMQPPVALLGYGTDDASLAVYYPFAVFSPEWQAIQWALANTIPVRFIDLPLSHSMAIEKAKIEEKIESTLAADETESDEDIAPPSDNPEVDTGLNQDPLNWLAQAAGHSDGESWWNQMVEERGDGEQLFIAIAEAMQNVRADLGGERHNQADIDRENLREAHMRQCVREAVKQGFTRIAVVCGAWHTPALDDAAATAKADAALLKGLPKIKVQCTWVPWTYRHLTRASGYGAGIRAPGWYEHVWHSTGDVGGSVSGSEVSANKISANETNTHNRTVGWLARVARLMRERDLDCSSAHIIEAARLADSLAAMRERAMPGVDELREACRTVLTMGDDAALQFIDDALMVGDRLGTVPADVPTVPLQRDVEAQQKRLRLKPEAAQRTLDLDLRQANDLERSHLLHRLNILNIDWGVVTRTGRTSKSSSGTFHEVWTLQWEPAFLLQLIEASVWGQTLEYAACGKANDIALKAGHLKALSILLDQVLLADLPTAVNAVTQAIQQRAALTGDIIEMLAALPPLANVFRYGSVRKTESSTVASVLDSLITRAAIGLALACQSMDDDAAANMRQHILAADSAIKLRDNADKTNAWQTALKQIAASSSAHELLQGLACRSLLDSAIWTSDDAAVCLSLHLSPGSDAKKSADWLDGFINRNAVVLLHDDKIWTLINNWLTGLNQEHFIRALPLIRRTFGVYSKGERRDLSQRASRNTAGAIITDTSKTSAWDSERAALPVSLLRQLLGLSP